MPKRRPMISGQLTLFTSSLEPIRELQVELRSTKEPLSKTFKQTVRQPQAPSVRNIKTYADKAYSLWLSPEQHKGAIAKTRAKARGLLEEIEGFIQAHKTGRSAMKPKDWQTIEQVKQELEWYANARF